MVSHAVTAPQKPFRIPRRPLTAVENFLDLRRLLIESQDLERDLNSVPRDLLAHVVLKMEAHDDGVMIHRQAVVCRNRANAVKATEWLITMAGGVVE